ncbi:phage tail assembly chaperone [Megasphaera elsdenii]|uniref:phage tail assembly chaperone n=1 Tax=Megasphaera elsdenii TaxID=907 RepID=UPI003521645E
MNAIDALLKTDTAKLTALPTKKFELPRLSKVTGTKFEVTVTAIPGELLNDITTAHVTYTKHGRVKDGNAYKTGLDLVVNGLKEPNLRDKKLLEHLGVTTPNQAAEKLFLAGELGQIASAVNELCGITSQVEVDETVKN